MDGHKIKKGFAVTHKNIRLRYEAEAVRKDAMDMKWSFNLMAKMFGVTRGTAFRWADVDTHDLLPGGERYDRVWEWLNDGTLDNQPLMDQVRPRIVAKYAAQDRKEALKRNDSSRKSEN